jgi:hypothetical protein
VFVKLTLLGHLLTHLDGTPIPRGRGTRASMSLSNYSNTVCGPRQFPSGHLLGMLVCASGFLVNLILAASTYDPRGVMVR